MTDTPTPPPGLSSRSESSKPSMSSKLAASTGSLVSSSSTPDFATGEPGGSEATQSQRAFAKLKRYLNQQVIGQPMLANRILVALVADGHLLVEGPPGLAKTRAIKTLGDGLECDFHRVQFTPDLLPSDLTGTDIYRPTTGEFTFQKGPIFHNLVLADEINRAPAKVQAALLEAMAERQVSVGQTTYQLPKLFLVMATQNPIEQEGTYPLPEAQLDRFLLHVKVDYPSVDAERAILKLARNESGTSVHEAPTPLSQSEVFEARSEALAIHMDPAVEEYIVQLTEATRRPDKYGAELANSLEYGVSPRATIALDRCARAHAWLSGKDHVTPDNVRAVLPDCFRHRLLLSFDAESRGVTSDSVINQLIRLVPIA